jgi:hypothetical protein
VNVLPPGTICSPEVSMPRLLSIVVCCWGQSSPTTPTSRTLVKKLAAIEK